MSKGLVTGTYLTNIGNAIRTKLGVQTTYQPSQMAAAIESIPTGGSNALDLSTGVRFSRSTFSTLPSQIANADWSAVTNGDYMFHECSNLTSIPQIDTSNFRSLAYTFYRCSRLTSIPLLDTGKVGTMSAAFQGCTALTSIPQIDTSNSTSTANMFYGCTALVSVPQFDTGKTRGMNAMFYECSSLTTVPQLDTSAVTGTGMRNMFGLCPALSNESLNNILAMCTSATLITNASYMTLKSVGLTSGQATVCEGLSNWNAFIAAGWTSGY